MGSLVHAESWERSIHNHWPQLAQALVAGEE